jgi:hypothetical protein
MRATILLPRRVVQKGTLQHKQFCEDCGGLVEGKFEGALRARFPPFPSAAANGEGGGPAVVRERGGLLLLGRLAGNLKVVFHAEDSGYGVCANASRVFVGLRVDHAVKLHMAILHRDADRLFRIHGVPVQ